MAIIFKNWLKDYKTNLVFCLALNSSPFTFVLVDGWMKDCLGGWIIWKKITMSACILKLDLWLESEFGKSSQLTVSVCQQLVSLAKMIF